MKSLKELKLKGNTGVSLMSGTTWAKYLEHYPGIEDVRETLSLLTLHN